MTANALPERFARLPRPVVVLVGLALVALIAMVDYFSGPRMLFSIFYLLPVMLVAWATASTLCGLIVAAATFAVEPVEAVLTHFADISPGLAVWNGAVRLAVFGIVLVLMARARHLMARLAEQASTDELTGLPNLRSLRETLARELERSRRFHHPLSLAYVDLDDFKGVNDRHGHGAGDRVLVTFAAVARTSCRAVDTVARVGGDEFVVLLPETGATPALLLADRLREAFSRATEGPLPPCTCSIGVAGFDEVPGEADALLAAADELMYRVKSRGGDDVEVGEFGREGQPIEVTAGAPRSQPHTLPA